jgi:hypothetical protein
MSLTLPVESFEQIAAILGMEETPRGYHQMPDRTPPPVELRFTKVTATSWDFHPGRGEARLELALLGPLVVSTP